MAPPFRLAALLSSQCIHYANLKALPHLPIPIYLSVIVVCGSSGDCGSEQGPEHEGSESETENAKARDHKLAPPFHLTGRCSASVVIISVSGLIFTSIHQTIFSFHRFVEIQGRNQNNVPNIKEASVKQKALKPGIMTNTSFPPDWPLSGQYREYKPIQPMEKTFYTL